MHLPQFQIEPFHEDDHEQVCELLVDSFRSKFQALVHLSDREMTELLMKLWTFDSRDVSVKQFVARKDGKIAGVLCLKWKPSEPRSNPQSQVNIIRFIRQYGPVKVLKLLTGLGALGYAPHETECYIEHLAVSSKERNQGAGQQLLNYAKNMAVQSRCKVLSLHVSCSNSQAIQLYRKLSFDIRRTRYNVLRHLIFREPAWHLMTWETSEITCRE
ncbi:GNAT family N-acetyltransferase [Paenibacillus sp. FSL L8-0470]|uniref:GNAT family N-acetyltransferase n=1 Tax=unclassified Paenibacillus TaxID=185978 RepID=UPI0030F93E5B